MLFDLALGLSPENLPSATEQQRVHVREAVRAIVWHDGKLLLVHTGSGDYKFPGGGITETESHLDALRREVREETGLTVAAVGACVGVTAERMQDRFEPGLIFTMYSHYYLATVSGQQESLELDAYEAELDFQPVWIEPASAVAANEAIILRNVSVNRWVHRETAVLKALLALGPGTPDMASS